MLWVVASQEVDNWAEWCTTVPDPGTYEVFAYIPRDKAGARGARYEVHHLQGKTEKTLDQSKWADEWVSLGSYDYDGGMPACVVLTNRVERVDDKW